MSLCGVYEDRIEGEGVRGRLLETGINKKSKYWRDSDTERNGDRGRVGES